MATIQEFNLAVTESLINSDQVPPNFDQMERTKQREKVGSIIAGLMVYSPDWLNTIFDKIGADEQDEFKLKKGIIARMVRNRLTNN